MEIVQVLIFVVIIAIAIVQQITKAKKETATPSPHEVLTDMFPTIEEIEGEGQTVSPRPVKHSNRHRLSLWIAKTKISSRTKTPVSNSVHAKKHDGPLFTRRFSIGNINNNNTNNQKTH